MRAFTVVCVLFTLGAAFPVGAAGTLPPAQAASAQVAQVSVVNVPQSTLLENPLTNEFLIQLVQETWTKCGHPMNLSDSLTRAAHATLIGMPRNAALKAQGYAALNSTDWIISLGAGKGLVAALSDSFLKKCGQLGDTNQFGLFTDGRKLSLIAAREAVVDLSQKERWLNEFLALTNEVRSQARACGGQVMPAAGPLEWDDQLTKAAEVQVTEMIRLDFTGHVNPKTGSNVVERVTQAGFQGRFTGENLVYGVITPQDAIRHLLESPGHCVNLMDARFTRFGAAVANGTAATKFPTYWAQVFGQP